MLRDIATLTGGTVISEEIGRKLDSRHARGLRPAPAASSRPRTTPRSSTARARPTQIKARMTPDQGADRGDDLGLRPREAPGAPRQAGRRRRRHQGRRGHRGRAQGEEAPHRGRALDDPRGRRGGHRRRRRHRAPAGDPGARQGQARGRRAGRRRHPAQGARGARPPDRRQRRPVTARSSSTKVRTLPSRARATTRSRASTATCSRKGIVDAAKVTRSALQNAASIAAMVLTTETLDHGHPGEGEGRRRLATATAAAGTWTSRGSVRVRDRPSTARPRTKWLVRAGSPFAVVRL